MSRTSKILLGCALTSIVVAGIYRDLIAAAFVTNPTPPTTGSIQRGRALYRDYCLICHGEAGKGDGVAAAGLAKKPKNLAAMKKPPIFPDGVVAYRIASGGEVMPAWKGILTEAQIWDLLNFIRSLSTSGADGRG